MKNISLKIVFCVESYKPHL